MNIHKNEKLIEAFDEYVRLQNDLLPDEEALSSITFSEEFRERMHRLLSRQKYGFYVLFGTAGRRIASFLVAALVAASVTTISVEALREPVFRFFAEVYEKFTQVIFADDTPDTPTEVVFNLKKPTYVPSDYEMIMENCTDISYYSLYTNENGKQFIFEQFLTGANIGIDTENVQLTELLINGRYGITYHQKGTSFLLFSDGTYSYRIGGTCHLEELIKIAESIT